MTLAFQRSRFWARAWHAEYIALAFGYDESFGLDGRLKEKGGWVVLSEIRA